MDTMSTVVPKSKSGNYGNIQYLVNGSLGGRVLHTATLNLKGVKVKPVPQKRFLPF